MLQSADEPYLTPISTDRKPWGRRIEVFSPKLGRRLTLLSQRCHDAWLLLEGDSAVRQFCERPVYLDGESGRVLDFWVDRGRHKQFWLIARRDEHDRPWPPRAHGRAVRILTTEHLLEREQVIANWGQIVPYLNAFRRHRDPRLEADVLRRLGKPYTIKTLEAAFHPIDTARVRSCLFELLVQGKVTSPGLAREPLSPMTAFRRALP